MGTNGNGQFLESELIHRKVKVDNEWQTRTFPVVGGRLRILHENNDHLGIQTEIIRLDNDFVVVKAAVESQRGKFNGTGTASGQRDAKLADSLVELAETRAIARALRFGGIGVEYTGAEEVSHVVAADSEKKQTGNKEPAPAFPEGNGNGKVAAKATSGAAADEGSKPKSAGMQTGAGTVMNSLKASKGSSIAIFGTGAVGLAAVMAARIVGPSPIIGVDMKPKRLEVALELGATHVINNRQDDVASHVTDITGSGVAYVVETTGSWKMHRLAIEVLNSHGTLAPLTGATGTTSLKEGQKTLSIIQGDAVPQRFIPQLIELYRAGQFPFDRLVKFYGFSEINKAIADAKRGDAIKPVLRISEV